MGVIFHTLSILCVNPNLLENELVESLKANLPGLALEKIVIKLLPDIEKLGR
jgi:hypothetical protein